MPVTIKAGQMGYKSPSSGEYVGINGVAERTTAEQIADVEAAGTAVIADIQTKADEVTAQLANAAEVRNMIAGVFDPNTAYTAGQYVIQTVTVSGSSVNKLFRFKVDHAAGAWDANEVIEVKLANDVVDLKSAIVYSEIEDAIDISDAESGYISSGSVHSGDDWYHKIFTAKKGDKIRLYTAGYSTNVSMIGIYKSGTYTTKVVSIDSTRRWYEYVAEEDGSYYVSIYILSQSELLLYKKCALMEDLDAITGETKSLQYVNGYMKVVGDKSFVSNDDYRCSEVFELHKGERIVFSANGEGNGLVSILASVTDDGSHVIQSIVTSTGNVYQDVDYTATGNIKCRISYSARKGQPVVHIYYANTDEIYDAVMSNFKKNIITVGTGKQYTSLITAINSITDSSKSNQYEIHLYEGTYDTVSSSLINSSYVGLIIPDYVSIIGIGDRDNIVIQGVCPTGYESYAKKISTLNFRDNGKLENVTVTATNLRYCNHDDYSSAGNVPVEHEYINCKFVMNTVSQGVDVPGACVGIGAMYGKKIKFNRCDFVNNNTDSNNRVCVLLHDGEGGTGAFMQIESCKFTGGRFNVSLITMSNPALWQYVELIGNSFNSTLYKPIYVANRNSAPNCFNIRAWANNKFTYDLGGSLTDISADVDAYMNGT